MNCNAVLKKNLQVSSNNSCYYCLAVFMGSNETRMEKRLKTLSLVKGCFWKNEVSDGDIVASSPESSNIIYTQASTILI